MTEHPGVDVVYDASDFRSLYSACARCRRTLMVIALAPAFVIAGFDIATGASLLAEVPVVVGFLGAGLILAAAIYFLSPPWQVGRRKRTGWSVPMRFALTEDAVTMIHPKQSSQWPWTAIVRVVLTADRLFLFISESCAIIVPKRAFGFDSDFSAFADSAEEHWQAKHRL